MLTQELLLHKIKIDEQRSSLKLSCFIWFFNSQAKFLKFFFKTNFKYTIYDRTLMTFKIQSPEQLPCSKRVIYTKK